MRFGLCTSLDNIQLAADMGYDYIEPSITSVIALSEEDYLQAVTKVERSGIICEAFNILFPSSIRLTGESFSEEKLIGHLHFAFKRASMLGADTIVLGSGGSRRIPDGMDFADGRKQLLHSVRIAGDIAAGYKLTIAVEPLNRNETNIITSVAEGAEFVKELGHPNIGLLVDFYHMRREDEPMTAVEDAGSLLSHVHIANGSTRAYPLSVDEDVYAGFFRALKRAGYDGRISVEGGTSDLRKDGTVALSVLKSLAAL